MVFFETIPLKVPLYISREAFVQIFSGIFSIENIMQKVSMNTKNIGGC